MSSLYTYLNSIKREGKGKYENLTNWEKDKVVSLLIDFLKEKMNCNYLYSIIDDVNGNSADALVLEDSKLFADELEGHDLLSYDLEYLIDNRYTKNDGEIIVLDVDSLLNTIDLTYLVESINSKHISYSKETQKYLEMFLTFLVKKKESIDNL